MLSLAEHDDAVARGIQTWCSICPIMIRCGEHAVAEGYSGPFGGRIFWEGKEVGTAEKHIRSMPGSSRRMYTENLSNHEQADRNHCHELFSQHVWREQESWLGVWLYCSTLPFCWECYGFDRDMADVVLDEQGGDQAVADVSAVVVGHGGGGYG